MFTVNDLKPGDIILMKLNGKAFHAMLYAPSPDGIGDILHVGYGLWRSGIVKSTLDHQIDILQKMNEDFQLHVIRSSTINPIDIVAQAEKWLRQGIPFDEMRGSDVIEREYNHTPETSPTLNTFQYLKYAARRDTAPVKPGEVYPYNHSGLIALSIGSKLHPMKPYPNSTPTYLEIGRGQLKKPERPKGFMCVGFVLACIGAAALKNEIQAVNAQTGWVSLKYGDLPAQNSNYKTALTAASQEAAFPDRHTMPGLHSLLTQEQLANFDLQRLEALLTPAIARLNPQHASVQGFLDETINDTANWQDLGTLDMTVKRDHFNKQTYRAETRQILEDIDQNRASFVRNFPNVTLHKKRPSFFSRFLCCGPREHKQDNNQTVLKQRLA